MNKELKDKILALDGERSKNEIGALFREFGEELTSDTVDVLKDVYRKNIYTDEKFQDRPHLTKRHIKENSAYIRRSAVLALVSVSREMGDDRVNAAVNDFLLQCMQDTDHEVRGAVFEVAPERFSSSQLNDAYARIRKLISTAGVTMPNQLDEYSAARRAIVRAMAEKLSMAGDKERTEIAEYIHSMIRKPLDPDPYVLAAAAHILGNYGLPEHIKALEEIVPIQEYPAHLKAEKAIARIRERKGKSQDTAKREMIIKIRALDISIRLLEEQKRVLRKSVENM